MSDGSDRLTFRDPRTFAEAGQRARWPAPGSRCSKLNELECVDGAVYANVWRTDVIARIDPGSGEVTGWIDASGLLPPANGSGADVLNGIAHVPERTPSSSPASSGLTCSRSSSCSASPRR